MQNPNKRDIPIEGLSFEVLLNGKRFARGVSKQDITVPAFGEVVLEAKAVGSLPDLIRQFAQLGRGPPEPFAYAIKGRIASTGATSYVFDESGTIELPGMAGGSK